MVGEVQYGGRVTDDYDKRLLNTYSKVWFSESVFADSFQFYQGSFLAYLQSCDWWLIITGYCNFQMLITAITCNCL